MFDKIDYSDRCVVHGVLMVNQFHVVADVVRGKVAERRKSDGGDSIPRRVLVTTHAHPDGDAMGATLALGHVLSRFGADVRLHFVTGVPRAYAWMNFPWPYVTTLGDLGSWVPDELYLVDCGDIHRSGSEIESVLSGTASLPHWDTVCSVNIDHHCANPEYAEFNWVESTCVATGQMVGTLAEYLGLTLEGPLGEAVYLALVCDSGGFSYSSTSAETFAMASRIIDNGLDLASFTANLENTWTLDRMQLWGQLMSEVTLHDDGKIACCVVSQKQMKDSAVNRDELEGLVGWLRRLKGVEASLFIREDAPGLCKISLRSSGSVNVHQVAAVFGGGGHKAAAGAELRLPLAEATQLVLAELTKTLRSVV